MKFKFYITTDIIKRKIYRIGQIRFINGFFATDNKDLQEVLEKSVLFNKDFRLAKTAEIVDIYPDLVTENDPMFKVETKIMPPIKKRGRKAKNDIIPSPKPN